MGSNICSVNYFCFGAVLIFVGSVLLCALGFTIVLPYEATVGWPETTCHVINSSYHHHLCSCDRQPTFDLDEFDTCVGKYPCLQIYVWFKVVVSSNQTENATLAPEEVGSAHALERVDDNSTANQTGDSYHVLRRTRREAGTSGAKDAAPGDSSGAKNNTTEEKTPVTEAVTSLKTSSLINTNNARVKTAAKNTRDKNRAGKNSYSSRNDSNSEPNADKNTTSKAAWSRMVASTESAIVQSAESLVDSAADAGDAERMVEGEEEGEEEGEAGVSSAQSVIDVTSLPPAAVSKAAVTSADVAKTSTEGESQDIIYTGLLFRAWTDAFYKQCTLHECGDEQWNRQETSRYRHTWGVKGENFSCYHHPSDPSSVILEKTPRIHMIHALVWPCVCLLTGSLLWAGLCFGCWSIESDPDEKFKHKYGQLK